MPITIDLSEFFKLRKSLPCVDVRSENEFASGHIQHAINIPLLTNSEREKVGTDYKQLGQAAAIKTGFRLVGPRLETLITEAGNVGSELIVHCWRGGMRSSFFSQFVEMAGVKTHIINGGYKLYRNFALHYLTTPFPFIIISGYTGSGKSEILRALKHVGEQVVDLEMLASHKGSAFGGLGMPAQPTTEQFQNDLFESIAELDLSKRIWIEDESITIGNVILPEQFWHTMLRSPVIEIIVDKQERINRLVKEYGQIDREGFLQAIKRIAKKLGGQHSQVAQEKLLHNDLYGTIEILLTYYDKSYTQSMVRKHSGSRSRIEWDGKSLQNIVTQLQHWKCH